MYRIFVFVILSVLCLVGTAPAKKPTATKGAKLAEKTLKTTKRPGIERECIRIARKQIIKPRSTCFGRELLIPLCFGLCQTSSPLLVNNKDITPNPECSCCQPTDFEDRPIKFVCQKGGKKFLTTISIKLPRGCTCESRCQDAGYKSEKLKPKEFESLDYLVQSRAEKTRIKLNNAFWK